MSGSFAVATAVTSSPTCLTPVPLNCAFGQTMKLINQPDGCQQFACECKPKEDCETINTNATSGEPGIVLVLDNSGCCPVAKEVCKVETCPQAPACPKFHTLEKSESGKCCPTYTCARPKGKCIVDLKFVADEKGGERGRNKFEKQQVLKEVKLV